jgi:hypothetical protein
MDGIKKLLSDTRLPAPSGNRRWTLAEIRKLSK